MIIFAVNQKVGKKVPPRLWRRGLGEAERVLKLRGRFEISIALVGSQEIKKINAIYRQKNSVTDVLSFGEQKSKFRLGGYLGEIIICYPQAARQAKKIGHTLNQELEILLIHGLLHLLGYDHEKSQKAADRKHRKNEGRV